MFSTDAVPVLAIALSLVGLGTALPSTAARSALPIVDLGYELHQAAALNPITNVYNFSNIRYAAPPLGNLRFAAPEKPAANRKTVETGSTGRVCPQAQPFWEAVAAVAVPEYLQGIPFNASAPLPTAGGAPAIDPRTTEDCLFLDVIVPKKVLEKGCKPAAVVVWFYGGGYVAGDKSAAWTDPSGLISKGDVIFVSVNYRLGTFGWLAGPEFQKQGGVANAGLYDQRAALGWVREHIGRFGGDAKRVTVMGESAGGGSIVHQITAFGGSKGKSPFQQAILQSPGYVPTTSLPHLDTVFSTFLALTNTTSLAALRALPPDSLIRANILQVAASPYGTSTFGPVLDGLFVPDLAGILLASGRFDHSVKLLTGYNANEGLLFASPYVVNETDYAAEIRAVYPDITPAALKYNAEVLYPPVYDGSYGYIDQRTRVAAGCAERAFVCNNLALAYASNNQSYAYEFVIPPALHGQDLNYTFYAGDKGQGVNATVAGAMQEAFRGFVIGGKPGGFVKYGSEGEVVRYGNGGIGVGRDDVAVGRCGWWLEGRWRD